MAAEFRIVDIWIGTFASEAAFEGYLHETYGDEDDTPMSKFAADMGQTFYDHDFLEAAYHDEPSTELGPLLADHSFARSYSPDAVAAFHRLAPGMINTVILIWGQEIKNPKSVRGTDYDLHHLGRFDSDPDA
jgi:hypothetical protein